MSNKKSLSIATFVVVPVIAILLGMVVATQPAFAYTSFDYGYYSGRAAYLDGNVFNSYCNPNYGDSYCAGYKLGYHAGWDAAALLYGGQK
jgi:hypothetical protein